MILEWLRQRKVDRIERENVRLHQRLRYLRVKQRLAEIDTLGLEEWGRRYGDLP